MILGLGNDVVDIRRIEQTIARYTDHPLGVHRRYAVIGHDELCGCCNGGRLLPSACHPKAA